MSDRLLDPFPDYDFIPDKDALLLHMLRPLPSYLRINPIYISEEDAVEAISAEGISLKRVAEVPLFYKADWDKGLGHTLSYKRGLFYPQALSSAIPCLALQPTAQCLILDMCAAPGGKTTYLAALTEDKGLIVANDRNIRRLTALNANIKRMGLTSIVVSSISGEAFPLYSRFDRVLVDAPCSGEGKYRIAPSGDVLSKSAGRANLPAIQKGLIVRSFDALAPNGVMVYSTCTINPLENEAVVAYLLKKRENAKIEQWSSPIASYQGLTAYRNHIFGEELRYAHRYYPHKIDSVGFFVAKISKSG